MQTNTTNTTTLINFNFSGHPVEDVEVAPFVGMNFPSDAEGLSVVIRETLLALPERDKLLAGASAEIVLPGLAHAAGVLLAEWHGQFGSFPRIKWAQRGPDGFTWSDAAKADLAAVRDTARTAR